MTPNRHDIEALARSLTEAQRRAILWCNADGSPRQHEKGAPSRVSFWALKNVVKGNPEITVAAHYKLVRRSEGGKVKGRMWPEDMWCLTPLGLLVRAHLQSQSQESRDG